MLGSHVFPCAVSFPLDLYLLVGFLDHMACFKLLEATLLLSPNSCSFQCTEAFSCLLLVFFVVCLFFFNFKELYKGLQRAMYLLSVDYRAVDNQVYVATASPARDDKASYVAWGHSTVVDPW